MWISRHLNLLDNHLFIPVVIADASLAGFAPSSIGNALHRVLRFTGANGVADTLQVSHNVVTNVWFWILLAGFEAWEFTTYIFACANFSTPNQRVDIPTIEPPDDEPPRKKKGPRFFWLRGWVSGSLCV